MIILLSLKNSIDNDLKYSLYLIFLFSFLFYNFFVYLDLETIGPCIKHSPKFRANYASRSLFALNILHIQDVVHF